jgi:hypothetical protein
MKQETGQETYKCGGTAPSERITRVRTFAALMNGIMQSRSVHLSHIALKLPGRAKELSIVRRIARAWLHSAAHTTNEVRLLVDSTKISFAH